MSLPIPDFFTIRNQIAALLIQVFGADLNTDSTAPTGQQIDLISNSYLQLYQLLSAVDLNGYVQQSQEQSLDNLLALINVFRPLGTKTKVPNVTLSGNPGTIIPADSLAKTTSGNIFYSGDLVTLNGFGFGTVDFFSQTIGAVAVAPNQLNTIVTTIPGWLTITNGSAGIPGENKVSDATLRVNHSKLVNQYSLGYLGNIYAKIYQHPEVKDVFIYENDKSVVSPPPYVSPANSLWIFLHYEDATKEQEIAESIFNSKAAVSTYSDSVGQVIKTVYDIANVAHDITWTRAIKVPIYIKINLKETSLLTIDIDTLIKNTLVEYIEENHKIGQILYYNRFLASVADIDDNIEIENFWVSGSYPPGPGNVVDIAPTFNEILTLSSANIEIIIL